LYRRFWAGAFASRAKLRGHHRIALGIERDDGDWIPVACMTRPTSWVSRLRLDVHPMSSAENVAVLADVTLRRADVTDATVLVVVVVPVYERARPLASLLQVRKPLRRKLR
jgi:hypothetical protein